MEPGDFAAMDAANEEIAQRVRFSPSCDMQVSVHMDEIMAVEAGNGWVAKWVAEKGIADLPGYKVHASDYDVPSRSDGSGGGMVRVKWYGVFDDYDRLVHGYLLNRDLKNWTQLTCFTMQADDPWKPVPVSALAREERGELVFARQMESGEWEYAMGRFYMGSVHANGMQRTWRPTHYRPLFPPKGQ
jgi:hypothetical protein